MPATVPIVDRALAAADAGLHVFPCAPMSKQPLKGIEWRKAATTDALQILAWFRETPNANYGIACGPGSDLGVVDLDGKASLEWWAARDFEQGALVRTPSGGRHVYYRTDATTEVQTNQGKIFKDEATGAQIDIRGWGGYVVGPGSMLPTGTYVGDIENIPMMPQAVLDILPEHQVFEYVRPDVAQVESATPAEERQLRSIAEWLRSLPSEWTPGAGWHDTVYRSACWLSRMVNSPEYALTPEQALDVLMAHTPTYAHWGPENIVRQWESAVQSTFGQYAETPRPVRELPAFAHVANKITLGGVEVDNLIAGAAHEDSWKDRRLLIATGAENGLDRDELVALAWQSPARGSGGRHVRAGGAGSRRGDRIGHDGGRRRRRTRPTCAPPPCQPVSSPRRTRSSPTRSARTSTVPKATGGAPATAATPRPASACTMRRTTA